MPHLNSGASPGPNKAGPAILIAATLLVLLSPIVENWKAKPADSFPLSYFPMFSAQRGSTLTGQSIVGVDGRGQRRVLPYQFAGNGGFNQVRRQVRAKVKAARSEELCATIAKRLRRSRKKDWSQLQTVQVLTVTHDVDKFFARGPSQISEKMHAACAVARPAPLTTQTQEERP